MKGARLLDLTCSPSCYPSSLGKRERAAQFGLSDENEESFECNQSFPRALQPPKTLKCNTDFSPDLNKIKALELNSVSFFKKNYFNKTSLNTTASLSNKKQAVFNESYHNTSCMEKTFDKSWAFYNQFISVNANEQQTDSSQLVAMANPNKALIVINGRTTEILTANNISCDLFGYNENTLIGMKLKDLLDLANKNDLIECDRLDENGRVVLCSGKIFEAITIDPLDEKEDDDRKSNTILIPVSMYMLKLTDETEPKCLCVMEPVQRVSGSFSVNLKGKIKQYNQNFRLVERFSLWTKRFLKLL
jgi:hypothetical protein